MGGRFLLSSESQKRQRSYTTALASALLEWILIVLLLVYGLFGYLITKFARYCELPLPCLLCSRIDRILGSEKVGFYRDMMCRNHKLEISSLVYCHFHEKLVDVRGMCETCLFSFATKDRSNAETYRLLVGKLGGDDLGGFDDDLAINDHKTNGLDVKHCCCCNELWTSSRHPQTLLQTKSSVFDDTDLNLPLSREISQDLIDVKKEVNSSRPLTDIKRKSEDSLVQFGYTELKVTSDTESDIQMSDAEDTRSLICDDPLRDLILDSRPMKPFIATSEDEAACDKPIDVDASSREPSETLHLVQFDIIDSHDGQSVGPASSIGHGLEELDWQDIDINLDPSASTHPVTFDCVVESPNDGNVSVSSAIDRSNTEEAGNVLEKVDVKDSKDLEVKKVGVAQTLVHANDKIEEMDSIQTTTDINSSNTRSDHKDGGFQMPNHLDLGDAYRLAISSRGKQLSGKLAGKESPSISADLKLLLSQMSRGSEFLSNDILSPRVSKNLDELKANDSSISIGMKFLQKRLSLERNDSKTSLDRNDSGIESFDFSTVSEIEGESELGRLRRQLEHDRKFLIALLKELEEERNASAIAINEAMAMITRLQEEKAAFQMEASQDLRMMEEQAEYDMEALDKLNDLMMEKEKEIQDLEAELEYYRTKYSNESMGNVGESASNACLSDSEKHLGAVNNLNILPDNTKSNSQDPLLEFEKERTYISECLNNLEKKLSAFCCNRVCQDLTNDDQSEEQGKDSRDVTLPEEGRKVKSETDENGVVSEKVGFIPTGSHQTLLRHVRSFKKSNSAGAEQGEMIRKEADILALINEVSTLSERLQALEADHSFIERSINTLKNGEEGLIQEIASRLRELRNIGIRRYDKATH